MKNDLYYSVSYQNNTIISDWLNNKRDKCYYINLVVLLDLGIQLLWTTKMGFFSIYSLFNWRYISMLHYYDSIKQFGIISLAVFFSHSLLFFLLPLGKSPECSDCEFAVSAAFALSRCFVLRIGSHAILQWYSSPFMWEPFLLNLLPLHLRSEDYK